MKQILRGVIMAALVLAANPVLAGPFAGCCSSSKSCNKGCGANFCVRQYNAFSPVAFGNITFDAFVPSSYAGPCCPPPCPPPCAPPPVMPVCSTCGPGGMPGMGHFDGMGGMPYSGLGQPHMGYPANGGMAYGAPGHGAPGYGAPGYGAPGYGVPSNGAPAYNAPLHSTPTNGYQPHMMPPTNGHPLPMPTPGAVPMGMGYQQWYNPMMQQAPMMHPSMMQMQAGQMMVPTAYPGYGAPAQGYVPYTPPGSQYSPGGPTLQQR